MSSEIKKAAEIIQNSKHMIALTGAGISVESGIPDFRSACGLWAKYDPAVYATIDSFIKMPSKVWNMIFEMIDLTVHAKPNSGHLALTEMEEMGFLKAVITQNIDNLHQEAGTKNVIEYHGNAKKLECMKCGKKFELEAFNLAAKKPPKCDKCDRILKPTVVFFGEMIPVDAMLKSQSFAESADVVLSIGTSAVVYPAAGIPILAKQHGAVVIEFNIEETGFTQGVTDIFIEGLSGTTLPEVVRNFRLS